MPCAGDKEKAKWSRGDTFLSIINGAPVPVIWMSESVNEVDGVKRSDRGDTFILGGWK